MNAKKFDWTAAWLVAVAVILIPSGSGYAETEQPPVAAEKTREAIYAEMESMLGLVPSFIKNIPDETLGLEWELMKRVQMVPGPIPNKYRELIGVAVAAATKCEFCIYFHTEFARLNGATEAEIEDALHYTKSTTGWSTYINGSQADMATFKAEINAIVEYLQKKAAASSNETE